MINASMKALAFGLLAVAACGDAPANPSDVAAAGTFASIAASELDDFDELNNFAGNNGTGNNGFGNNGAGPYPYDLDCTATITISGPVSGTFENTGCAAASEGTKSSLSWLFPSDVSLLCDVLNISDIDPQPTGTLPEFDALTTYQQAEQNGEFKGWIGTCAVRLTGNAPYTDANGQPRAIWAGTLTCDEPLLPHTRDANQLGSDWVPDETGEALTLESFAFETPCPFAG